MTTTLFVIPRRNDVEIEESDQRSSKVDKGKVGKIKIEIDFYPITVRD